MSAPLSFCLVTTFYPPYHFGGEAMYLHRLSNALAERGHRVTVVERDPTPLPASADEAFFWDRRGAPQVRHSHAFLGRLRTLLRDRYPDVLQALYDAGATDMRFGADLPPTVRGYVPEPGDDDLALLACRRTTFEWVLRRIVVNEGRVTIRTGVPVTGLVSRGGRPRRVAGVRCGDAPLLGDLVVIANGRRSAAPEWLADIGAPPVREEVEDTGIVYFSRFYRLRPGQVAPPRIGPIGGDLGYLKFGVFPGDNRSFSVTLATPTDDDELRTALTDPATFERGAGQLPPTARWIEPDRSEPITEVHLMAGLLNREREFVIDGVPIVTGLVAVGDARLCTNPLYGRGCSTAMWMAELLATAIDAATPTGRGIEIVRAYDSAVRREIEPWYRSTVIQDAEARRVAAALLAGEDPDGDQTDPRSFLRAVFREGLLPALRLDAIVLRAFSRNFNLFSPPDALMTDPDVGARVLAVFQDRENRAPEPALGPKDRAQFVAALAS